MSWRIGREIGKREQEARDGEGGAACAATPHRRRCWGCCGVCRRCGQRGKGVFHEEKEVLPAPPFIPIISRAHRRCVFKERVSLEELPFAISSLTHLTDMANLFSLQVWAGFGERSRDGNKFVVAERLVKQGNTS
ncbi:hypothetical protein HN51_012696 [Arachis hypogaea]